MKLIDITKTHRTLKDKRAISEFFRSAGYKRALGYLQDAGLTEEEVVVRSPAHRSSPSAAKVHAVIMMEYVRWVDYGKFCDVFLNHYNTHMLMVERVGAETTKIHNPTGALNG